MTRRTNILIVGAGPAGMAAAVAAAECGAQVTLIDDNPSPGGQIWRGLGQSSTPKTEFGHIAATLLEKLRCSSIEWLRNTRVVSQPAPGFLRVEEESNSSDLPWDRLILATGARELFLPFPGWTLPGVMGAGGLQAMVKSGLPIAGKRVVLAGSGPLLLAVAAALKENGAHIAGIFEQAPIARLAAFGTSLIAFPGKLLEGARYRLATRSAPYRTSSWTVRANGADALRSVTIQRGSIQENIPCDYLGCGFHLVPNLELPRLLGCEIDGGYVSVNATQQTSVPHIYGIGELTGIGGLDKALLEGEIAGRFAAGSDAAHLARKRDRFARFARRLDRAFAPRKEVRMLPDESTIVCRCEDVPYSAMKAAHNWRDAKLHTRCGMGPCQGRICASAAQSLFGWSIDSVRPPLFPARVSTLAAGLSSGSDIQRGQQL